MLAGAYPYAAMIYPVLLLGTIAVGIAGIILDHKGSRRVGAVMIACQLVLLALAFWGIWPEYRLAGMTIVNGLCAVPLLVSPPHPPHRLQRFAAGLFLSSALINAMFGLSDMTPFLVTVLWFASAAIDALLILMLGGFCGGLVGKDIADRLHRRADRASRAGHSR